jgi:hypothetical protein
MTERSNLDLGLDYRAGINAPKPPDAGKVATANEEGLNLKYVPISELASGLAPPVAPRAELTPGPRVAPRSPTGASRGAAGAEAGAGTQRAPAALAARGRPPAAEAAAGAR